MNFRELQEYMENEIDMNKFKEAVIKQIEISNLEILDEKNKLKEDKYEFHIKLMWNKVVNDVYSKVSGALNKKTISQREAWLYQIEKQEVIQSLNDSFNDI